MFAFTLYLQNMRLNSRLIISAARWLKNPPRRDRGCRISDELALFGVRPRFFWAARSEWAGLRQAHCASRACARTCVT